MKGRQPASKLEVIRQTDRLLWRPTQERPKSFLP